MMSLPAIDLNADSGTVTLPMKHMLTSIGFSAIGTLDQIESITVKNIVVSGTVSYDSSGDSLKWDLGDITTTPYNARSEERRGGKECRVCCWLPRWAVL